MVFKRKSAFIAIAIAATILAFTCGALLCLTGLGTISTIVARAEEESPVYAISIDNSVAAGYGNFEIDGNKITLDYNSHSIDFPVRVRVDGVTLTDDKYVKSCTYTAADIIGYESGSEVAPTYVGTYDVSVVISDEENGELVSAEYQLVIAPKAVNLTVHALFNDGSNRKEYDGSSVRREVTLDGTCDGDIGDDESGVPKLYAIVTYEGIKEEHKLKPEERPVHADEYEMKFALNNPNYRIGTVTYEGDSEFLTITKSTLTAKADDVYVTYGKTPKFTVSIKGHANPEIDVMPTVHTAATEVGTHVIIPSGGSAENFNFIYEEGTLTINAVKAEGDIVGSAINMTFEGVFLPGTTYTGTEIDLKGQEGRDILYDVRKFKMTDFTSSPKYILKISAENGGARPDSDSEDQKEGLTKLTFRNINLDASKKYFIVFKGARGTVTKITKYEYGNGTLTFNSYEAAGTLVVYRNSQALIITLIVAGAVILFCLLLLLASAISYRNDKRDIENRIRAKKKARSKYRW